MIAGDSSIGLLLDAVVNPQREGYSHDFGYIKTVLSDGETVIDHVFNVSGVDLIPAALTDASMATLSVIAGESTSLWVNFTTFNPLPVGAGVLVQIPSTFASADASSVLDVVGMGGSWNVESVTVTVDPAGWVIYVQRDVWTIA